MRVFEDSQGNQWQAALLSASYGCIVLIFSALEGEDIRQQLLGSDNQVEAEAELAAFDDDALRGMLAKAPPWDPTLGSVPLA